jgi:hypothetical protein
MTKSPTKKTEHSCILVRIGSRARRMIGSGMHINNKSVAMFVLPIVITASAAVVQSGP